MLRKIACVAVLLAAAGGAAFAESASGIWLDVPYVAQTKDGCGAASLSMVMQYWEHQEGQQKSEAADASHILHVLYARKAHGIYASAMVGYLERHGYRAFAFTGDWAMVEDHLRHGRPLIAALRPEGSHALHYVVLVGMEPEQHLILVNDSDQRKLMKVDETEFDHEWKATGYWTLLAVPTDGAR